MIAEIILAIIGVLVLGVGLIVWAAEGAYQKKTGERGNARPILLLFAVGVGLIAPLAWQVFT